MICLICNMKMKSINNTHLRSKHDMLPSEYEKKFGIKLEIYKKTGKKISKALQEGFKSGRIKAWNKGLTKETSESVLKYSNSLIGHPVSDKVRDRWIGYAKEGMGSKYRTYENNYGRR